MIFRFFFVCVFFFQEWKIFSYFQRKQKKKHTSQEKRLNSDFASTLETLHQKIVCFRLKAQWDLWLSDLG